MSILDWSVFALYFGAVLAFAYFQSRKNVGLEGYFLANRRLPWGGYRSLGHGHPGQCHHLYRHHRTSL